MDRDLQALLIGLSLFVIVASVFFALAQFARPLTETPKAETVFVPITD